MKTSVVTGSQSGMGLAIRTELESKGWRVLGVDLPGKKAEVEGDLSTPAGREGAAAGGSDRPVRTRAARGAPDEGRAGRDRCGAAAVLAVAARLRAARPTGRPPTWGG